MTVPPLIIPLLMAVIAASSCIAIWHLVGAIARMSPRAPLAIRLAYVAKATGLATIVAAVLDHFLGAPYTWPWLMLAGVGLTNAGTAALHIARGRNSTCPECPATGRYADDWKVTP